MKDLLENLPEQDPLNTPELRMKIDQIINDHRDLPGAAMVVLNEIQNEIGFITEPMQAYIAKSLHMPLGAIHGVVTFYSFFKTRPTGKHTIKFCMGTACYVGGTPQLIEKAKIALGIELGETTPDGMITLEACRCVGACSQAPVVIIDEEAHGRVRPNKLPQMLRKIQDDRPGEKIKHEQSA